jgi:hypothetical protein
MAKNGGNNFNIARTTHNNLAETKFAEYTNARTIHNFNINNIKLPKVKMHYTSPVKIIPLPFAFLRTTSRAPCRVPLADRRKLTGTSQPNARGTLLPP